MTSSTLLFHLDDELKMSFSPASEKRPVFYWFNDCYHSHIYGDTPGANYIYFFLLKPRATTAKLFTRHGKGNFKSMWSDYQHYLDERKIKEELGTKAYIEPGIVMSFSELVPDVICKFIDGFTVAAHSVAANKSVYFSLFHEGRFRRFNEIPELVDLLPDITNSVPIVTPTSQEVDDPSSFWPADHDNEGRMWL